MKEKDLINLNSKVLNEASIEELEERLELTQASGQGCWTDCNYYDLIYCTDEVHY